MLEQLARDADVAADAQARQAVDAYGLVDPARARSEQLGGLLKQA
jgi:hypothetical protein